MPAPWATNLGILGGELVKTSHTSPGREPGDFSHTSPGREPGDFGNEGHPACHAARAQMQLEARFFRRLKRCLTMGGA